MRFRYEAKDKGAVYQEGIIEAPSRKEALERLYSRGFFVFSIAEVAYEPKGAFPAQEALVGVRGLGVWVLAYGLLWVNSLGFLAVFGFALAEGNSAVKPGIAVDLLLLAAAVLAILANALLIAGGIGCILDKRWSAAVSSMGITSVFLFALALLCATAFYPGFFEGEKSLYYIAWVLIVIPGAFLLSKFNRIACSGSASPILRRLLWAAIALISFLLVSYLVGAIHGTFRHSQPTAAKKNNGLAARPAPQARTAVQRSLSNEESLALVPELEEEAARYYTLGRYREAKEIYEQLWNIKKNALGAANPEVTSLLEKQAELERLISKDKEVGYLTVVDGDESAMAPPALPPPAAQADISEELYQEAKDYIAKARFKDAERLLTQSLSLKEEALGSEHAELVSVMAELAALYKRTLRFEEAQKLYARLLAIQEKTPGADDLVLAQTRYELGTCLLARGDLQGARILLEAALAARKEKLGMQSVQTADSLVALADLCRAEKDLRAAIPLYKEAAFVMERALGPLDLKVADAFQKWGDSSFAQGNDTEALEAWKKALTIKEGVLGRDHQDLAAIISGMAVSYERLSNFQAAEEFYRRALNIRQLIPGSSDQELFSSLFSLGTFCYRRGKLSDAEQFLEEAIAKGEVAFGAGHLRVGEARYALAEVYLAKNDLEHAKSFFEEALAVFESASGQDSDETVRCLKKLAGIYFEKRNFAYTENLLLRILKVAEKKYKPGDARIRQARTDVMQFYRSIGEKALAQEYEKKLNEPQLEDGEEKQ